jgi:glycosyltransferase involved in cell wall biosynthesis
MRHDLLLDIQGAQSPGHGERGIARYVTGHARALLRSSDRIRGLLLSPFLPFPGNLPAELLSSPRLQWNTATEVSRHRAPIAYHVMSPFELHDPTTGVVPPHLMTPEIPLIVTLYDLVPHFWPQHYLADKAWEKRYTQRLELVRGADLVLTISDATREDAIRELGVEPERVVTIGVGVPRQFTPATAGSDARGSVRRRFPGVRGGYVFSVGAPDWRKNTERLISAYAGLPAAVRRDHQLVITCDVPDDVRERWVDHAHAAGLDADELVLTGRVDDATLVNLYQAATLFVFPSLYEGFGLPVAEAIACGAPAITSNTSSLPEVLDHPAATFDPNDVAEMAQVLERGVVDSEFRRELITSARERAPLFRWDLVADRTIAAVETVIDGRRRDPAHRRSRLRVALVTPLAPDPSAVAAYNARLIPHLARYVDLEVLYPDLGGKPLLQWPGVTCLPVGGLGRFINPQSYDAIVYAIGDSAIHVPAYEAALHFPGIVWFHDVRLGQLYWSHATKTGLGVDHVIRDQVQRFYAKRAPHSVGTWTPELMARHGLNLTPELAQRSRHVIVNSSVAAQMVRLDQGGDVRCPDITVLPRAASPCRPEGPMTRVAPPVVAALGGDSHTDMLFADAVALIQENRRPQISRTDEPSTALTCVVDFGGDESLDALRDTLALGLPAISTVAGVIRDFPAGTLVSSHGHLTAASLARQIDMLCSDADVWQRYSSAAWRYSTTFTTEEMAGRLAQVVATAIAQ